MVRSILEGRKTQTRRIVKPQPMWVAEPGVPFKTPDADPSGIIKCPYGQPGDRLWVKETHRFDGLDPKIALRSQLLDDIVYRADMDGDRSIDDCPWRPSIFMPRWASRITLEIDSVRAERLQDIGESDCRAEGCKGGNGSIPGYAFSATPREHYRHVWQSTYGPGSWDANQWVWRIEFKEVKP